MFVIEGSGLLPVRLKSELFNEAVDRLAETRGEHEHRLRSVTNALTWWLVFAYASIVVPSWTDET